MSIVPFLWTLCALTAVAGGDVLLPASCDIFCHGELLDSVQRAGLFNDSKYFVDMTMKREATDILRAFQLLPDKEDKKALRQFVHDYFEQPGSELELCDPVDWVPRPESFKAIRDPYFRLWANLIHQKWHKLCRKVKNVVHENPNLYSFIPVTRPFIIPGGRFREMYYWDSYWIIKGLLASGMHTTAKDMMLNMASMVERYGFVPNGGRIYYLSRSQPPMLTYCLYDYFNATGDIEFVQHMLPVLEKEYDFWTSKRTVSLRMGTGEWVRLFQYQVQTDQPRPESYIEDLRTAAHARTRQDKEQLWSDIAAACESGMDFSSRWFSRVGPHRATMKSIRTSHIIPVDLNAYICGNNLMMSKLYRTIGDSDMAMEHKKRFLAAKDLMQKMFWDPVDRIWYDYDMDMGMRVPSYYASNLVPLYTGCFDESIEAEEAVVDYLKNTDVLHMPHGLPTSLTWTDEQWDRPNGWPPFIHMVVEGLRRSSIPEAQEIAYDIVRKWLELNFGVFLRTGGRMFEKYNVENGFAAGGGGEYDVQEGFGWTNGVALDLLLKYGDRLTLSFVPADAIMEPL